MDGGTTSATAGFENSVAPRPANTTPTRLSAPPIGGSPDESLLRSEYQRLTRQHLGGLLDKLFADYTGLHFHIAWAPAGTQAWDARTLPTGCSVCCRLAGIRLEAELACRVCGPRQLARALCRDGEGLSFTCRLGGLNCWIPIRVQGLAIGIAYLQTFDGRRGQPTARRPAMGSPTGASSRSGFRQASRLLRLMIRHVETLTFAELCKADLARTQRALEESRTVASHLREDLNVRIPAIHKTVPVLQTESRSEQIVRDLLHYISQNYGRPITLKECAFRLGYNEAYLSTLFSSRVGLRFKTYLTELRLEKARELLSDPAFAVSQVAGAVGFTCEDRFRSAFKKVTGLAPKVWRETLRMQSKALVLWLLYELDLVENLALPLGF